MAPAAQETSMKRKYARLTNAPCGKTGVLGPPAMPNAEEASKRERETAKTAIQGSEDVSGSTTSRRNATLRRVQLGSPGRLGPSAARRVELDANIDTDTATSRASARETRSTAASALPERAPHGKNGAAGASAQSPAEAAALRRGSESAAARESASLTSTRKTQTRNFRNVAQAACVVSSSFFF